MPLISIIMPVYNGEKFLAEAIESILEQTFKDFELIIINDGSTDNSKNIIKNYVDQRILYLEQKNKGLSKALNFGFKHSKGELIARMDQDDISVRIRLMKQFLFLKNNPNISVVSSACEYIDSNGRYLGRSFPITSSYLIKKKLLKSGCVISHPAVMMRRKDFINVGCYSEIVGDKFTDYHLWIKFVKRGYKIKNLSEALIRYRLINTSMSSEFSLNKNAQEQVVTTLNMSNPTKNNFLELKKITNLSLNDVNKREKLYINIENYLYQNIPFLSYECKVYIVTFLKNILKFII